MSRISMMVGALGWPVPDYGDSRQLQSHRCLREGAGWLFTLTDGNAATFEPLALCKLLAVNDRGR